MASFITVGGAFSEANCPFQSRYVGLFVIIERVVVVMAVRAQQVDDFKILLMNGPLSLSRYMHWYDIILDIF